MKTLEVVLMVIISLLIHFIFTALVVYGICWALGFVFTWKLAIAAWLIITVLSSILKK